MKKLSNFERKHLLLGLLLMCGSIIFYVICTKDVESTNVFRVFFPVFWGLYTVVSIVYVILTGWLKTKVSGEDEEDSKEDIEKEISERRFLLVTNILTAVTLVVGYLSSTFKNISTQYSTYQPLGWTLAICVEIAMYVIYLFKEDKPEPIKEEKPKAEGVQLVSYEEAMRILEENGYEIEEEATEEKEGDDVVEGDIVKEEPHEEPEENAEENAEESKSEENSNPEPKKELKESSSDKPKIEAKETLPVVRDTKPVSRARTTHRRYRSKKKQERR